MNTTRTGVGGTLLGSHVGLLVRCLGIARGDAMGGLAYFEGLGRHDVPGVGSCLKAMVDPNSVADLSSATRAVRTDFVELLRAATVIGRMRGLRRGPFNVRMLAGTGGAAAAWTGEGEPAPLGKLELTDNGLQLLPTKIAGIAAITAELARHSTPTSDSLLARDLVKAIAEQMDRSFIDPASGATDRRPASIAHGASSFESSGSGIAAIDVDLQRLVGVLTDANLDLGTAHWVMAPRTAASLALLRGSGGAPAYPLVHARGGELLGLPVIVSTACAASGSPLERFLLLAQADEILVADADQAEISVSTRAALQMDDAPSAGAQAVVSLWQNGLIAVLGSRWINWRTRRGGAVATLRSVEY